MSFCVKKNSLYNRKIGFPIQIMIYAKSANNYMVRHGGFAPLCLSQSLIHHSAIVLVVGCVVTFLSCQFLK